jgi:protein O-GlcNAc transferase
MFPPTLSSRPAAPAAPHPEAERHWRGGVEHARGGRWKEAEKAHARAVRLAPREPLYWVNLGQARRQLGDLDGAAAAADEALRVDPTYWVAAQLRLATRLERHRYAEALEDAERVTRHPGSTYQQWTDYGLALYHSGRFRESASALLQALTRKPDHFEAYVMLCNVFDRLNLHSEAVECLRTGLALKGDWGTGLGGVVFHSLFACDWSRLDADLEALRTLLERPGPHEFGPFMFLSFGADAARQLTVFREHARIHFGAVVPMPTRPPHQHPPVARIRVGYLSNDLQQHATALLLVQVLELHDRERFEVRLYSYGPDDDSELRRRLRAACEDFVDVGGMSDRETAQRIRDDGNEILVDLKGYTLNARTPVVAMRPAPIQVAYLGFPGTMGAPFIDYAIVDPVVAPPSMAEAFSEKLAWMPDCYQPNDRLREVGESTGRSAWGLPEDAVVLCCFNHTYKIRPALFDIWCRVLKDTPGSVLWLLQSNEQARDNLLREAAARGIGPDRIVFAPVVSSCENLARLVHADLFLDTLPVNAHTTASDALWSGVPVLTCAGDSFVGRVAASLLHAVGMPELVTSDLAAYEALARSLAADPQRLTVLKTRLIAACATAPLFDSLRTARAIEDLYARMVERWRAGLPPDHLPPRAIDGTASPSGVQPL